MKGHMKDITKVSYLYIALLIDIFTSLKRKFMYQQHIVKKNVCRRNLRFMI